MLCKEHEYMFVLEDRTVRLGVEVYSREDVPAIPEEYEAARFVLEGANNFYGEVLAAIEGKAAVLKAYFPALTKDSSKEDVLRSTVFAVRILNKRYAAYTDETIEQLDSCGWVIGEDEVDFSDRPITEVPPLLEIGKIISRGRDLACESQYFETDGSWWHQQGTLIFRNNRITLLDLPEIGLAKLVCENISNLDITHCKARVGNVTIKNCDLCDRDLQLYFDQNKVERYFFSEHDFSCNRLTEECFSVFTRCFNHSRHARVSLDVSYNRIKGDIRLPEGFRRVVAVGNQITSIQGTKGLTFLDVTENPGMDGKGILPSSVTGVSQGTRVITTYDFTKETPCRKRRKNA